MKIIQGFNDVHCGDRLVGFRCSECGEVFQSMWGDTCNSCRTAERRHREIVKALTKDRGK